MRDGLPRIQDGHTLLMPDRRNIVRDARVALMLLASGGGNALRIDGAAFITADAAPRESFAVEGQARWRETIRAGNIRAD